MPNLDLSVQVAATAARTAAATAATTATAAPAAVGLAAGVLVCLLACLLAGWLSYSSNSSSKGTFFKALKYFATCSMFELLNHYNQPFLGFYCPGVATT